MNLTAKRQLTIGASLFLLMILRSRAGKGKDLDPGFGQNTPSKPDADDEAPPAAPPVAEPPAPRGVDELFLQSQPIKIVQSEEDPSVAQIELPRQIKFKKGTSEISPDSEGTLNQIVSVMRGVKRDALLRIEGYASKDGKDEANLKLSQKRADAAMFYLTARGISSSRMAAYGYGETMAHQGRIDPTDRRVDFILVEDEADLRDPGHS